MPRRRSRTGSTRSTHEWSCARNELQTKRRHDSIIFHIHDTSDGVYDAEVILDAFEFLGYFEQGTTPIE